jgi:ribose 5-phosphate isomerase B
MKTYIGADHQGFELKGRLVNYLRQAGYDIVDDGSKTLDPNDDYPIFAQRVVKDVLSSDDHQSRGILICGSGQGMCMAANRFKGIRACLGYDLESVRAARNDDDSNVLCLPVKVLGKDTDFTIVETWLKTPFEGATRFVRRIKEMDEIG